MSITVDITRLDDTESFLARWVELNAVADKRSFFQSPAWVGTWLKQVEGREIYGVEARLGDAVIGMGAVGLKASRLPGLSSLRLFETGDDALDAVYTEYNDFLVSAMAPDETIPEMWSSVMAHFSGVNSLIIRNGTVRGVAGLSAAAMRHGWSLSVVREENSWVCPLKALREDGKSVLDSLSANTRRQVKKAASLYEEQGDLILTTVVPSPDWAAAWQRLQELHGATWAARGQGGVFANPALLAFHETLQQEHPEAVEIVEVRAGDSLIGSLYNFRHEGHVLNYQSGFQYAEDNRLKPGLLTHALAAQHYLGQGLDVYDMLVGDVQYKKSLGTKFAKMVLIETRKTFMSLMLRYF